MPQTAVEKIVQRYAVGISPADELRAGDFVTVRPQHVMTHDNTAAVLLKFQSIGATKVADPGQPVFALDHDIQNTDAGNLAKYERIEAFARDQGIAFHPAGRGIGHQIMAEEGFARPGSFVVASDSHSNLYGALSAVGTPVVRTDAAAIWATGTTWWQLPPAARVRLSGKLRPGVSGKDLIITLIGLYSNDEVLNHAVEFHGPGVATLSMDQRMTIANMTTEWGALVGWFPFDGVLEAYLMERAELMRKRGDGSPRVEESQIARWKQDRAVPDDDAWYAKEIELDLSQLSPHVAGPDQVKLIHPVEELAKEKVAIHKAYLLSCVNSRLEDLHEAAEVLRGRRIADGVEMYVAAASSEVENAAREDGSWQALLDAGATALPSGCGPCIGLGAGTLGEGEVGISATNRNFKGRMGHRSAEAYLASPAVVAASALAGRIASPHPLGSGKPPYSLRENPKPPASGRESAILDGFYSELRGRLLFVPADNLNTDGIYGKDWTYRDDLSNDEMGSKAMLNHDPAFQGIAQDGDILVGGRNFGTGSSREQAATALKFRGIRMVVAASFSETYKRNAFNNGFVVVESPELVEHLRDSLKVQLEQGTPTLVAQGEARVDFRGAEIHYDGGSFPMSRLSTTAQELVVAGGSEGLVQRSLGAG